MRQARLAFIEAHLEVHGSIGRRDFLDCASATATRVLTQYRELHPDVLVFDPEMRRYVAPAPLELHHLKVAASDFMAAYNLIYLENN